VNKRHTKTFRASLGKYGQKSFWTPKNLPAHILYMQFVLLLLYKDKKITDVKLIKNVGHVFCQML